MADMVYAFVADHAFALTVAGLSAYWYGTVLDVVLAEPGGAAA